MPQYWESQKLKDAPATKKNRKQQIKKEVIDKKKQVKAEQL